MLFFSKYQHIAFFYRLRICPGRYTSQINLALCPKKLYFSSFYLLLIASSVLESVAVVAGFYDVATRS